MESLWIYESYEIRIKRNTGKYCAHIHANGRSRSGKCKRKEGKHETWMAQNCREKIAFFLPTNLTIQRHFTFAFCNLFFPIPKFSNENENCNESKILNEKIKQILMMSLFSGSGFHCTFTVAFELSYSHTYFAVFELSLFDLWISLQQNFSFFLFIRWLDFVFRLTLSCVCFVSHLNTFTCDVDAKKHVFFVYFCAEGCFFSLLFFFPSHIVKRWANK